MKANYTAFVDRMIQRYEGGYGWDVGDPGGPTKYGITCYDLAEHRGQHMTSMATWAPIVRAMTLAEAETIYATKYATRVQFDLLNSGPDCAIMDFEVNSGTWGTKIAQRVVGVVSDGILGQGSLTAINSMDPLTFVNKYCDARLAFMHQIPTWSRFGVGWSSRVADLRAYCKKLAVVAPVGLMDSADEETFEDKPQQIGLAFAKAHD